MAGWSDTHRQAFKEEAYELLGELETALLDLEERPDDPDLIGRVFRAMHTIKGSGAMCGFDEVAAFTHEVETVFDLVRNGSVAVSRELIDLTLSSRDLIRAMIDASNGDGDAAVERSGEIVTGLKRLVPGSAASPGRPLPASRKEDSGAAEGTGGLVTYRIYFSPAPDIFARGVNPLLLLNELRSLGGCNIIAHTETIPMLEEFDPEQCRTAWEVLLTTDKGINAVKDVFIFIADDSELDIEVVRTPAGVSADGGSIESAFLEQHHARAQREDSRKNESGQKGESSASMRVPSEKLDSLVDLVGELVTVQARLSQFSGMRREPALQVIAEEVERISTSLRDKVMNIRMLPIGSTFAKFKRLVRDLSKELGKEIELTTEGAETELDKTVIEKLNDPLVHLIRNSIDHGIEPPGVREAAGKPRRGTVRLSASHSGAFVVIRIQDDGKGLDPEAIRAKAVEKGLIAPDAEVSEKELFALILAPGFSTAQKVTNVSGRGVGMDVVKRAIDDLQGRITVASEKGCGATITLTLPLTLAIIEGLLVKIGGDHFVLPLSAVEECVELTAGDAAKTHGRHIANVRGSIVPYIRLRERFGSEGARPGIEQIVITRVDGQRVGLVVDEVIGEHQTVIKNLGRLYRNADAMSGATILGDGTVALIIDIPHLVKSEEGRARETVRRE